MHSNDKDLSSLRHLGLAIDDWKLDLAPNESASKGTVYVIVRILDSHAPLPRHADEMRALGYLGNGGVYFKQQQQAKRSGVRSDSTESLQPATTRKFSTKGSSSPPCVSREQRKHG